MKPCQYFLLAVLSCASPAFATVSVTSPTPGSTVPSPVHYVATATTTTCAAGVASMGVYVNNVRVYVVNGTSLNTSIAMANGAEHTVVEEWDKCGGATVFTDNIIVGTPAPPSVSMTANPLTVTAGTSSKLIVTAAQASTVTVSGSDGSVYHLAATGGSLTVTPSATTTYTAEVSGSTGNASQASTVTVIPAASLNAISHVVLMLQENRSFDHYFGMLNPYRKANGLNIGDDGKDYEVDGVDDKLTTISNSDDEGTSYPLFKLKSTCVDDETSAWLESYGDVNRWDFSTTRAIKMDGFVHIAEGFSTRCNNGTSKCSGQFTDTTGERAMGYYDQGFLNYYYYMASQFALSDRWFSPVSSKSIPNRIATFTGGTTQGLEFDPGSDDHLPQLNIPTIFQELDTAKVSWKIYYTTTDDLCLASSPCQTTNPYGNYPDTTFSSLSYSFRYLYFNSTHAACTGTTKASSVVGDSTNSFCIDPNHIAPLSQYYTDLTNGTLPSFAFIESGSGVNDEHPGSGNSILKGQTQVATVVAALTKSSSWKNTVFFLTYDEGGGPYDHVPPVPGHSNQNTDASLGSIPDISSIAVNPDSYQPCQPSGAPTTHCDLVTGDPGTKTTDAEYVNGVSAQLGFRVPNIVISPFTRKHYVSHTPMDHTAIIKFVENRFIGSSTHLTARDAAQSNLLEFFDFTKIPWSTPPTPPTPISATSLGYDPCSASNM